MVKLIAVDALPAVASEMLVGNLVLRGFEPELSEVGQSVSFLDETVEMRRLVEATFHIPDVTKVLAVPDLLKLYMAPATTTIVEQVELDLLGSAAYFPAMARAPIEKLFDHVEVLMSKASANARVVLTGEAYAAVRRLSGFYEYSSAAAAGLRSLVDGPVARYKQLYLFRSGHAKGSMAFSRESIALVTRRIPRINEKGVFEEYAELGNFGLKVSLAHNPNSLAQRITISILYGTKVRLPNQGIALAVPE